jgi:CDP-diacylglycerol---glycerol-3-phosphate 3-phosphatidyltransferase
MAPLVNPAESNASLPSKSSVTLVYPLSQLAPFAAAGQDSLSTETIGVGYVLDILAEPTFKGGKWVFTAGYFNPSAGVKRGLLYGKSTTGTVITASAEANGFFNAPNPSGYLPDAYMILARRFLEDVQRHGMGNAIKLVEWRHNGAPGVVGDGWTYHAKGIWITAPDSKYPSLTLIGSSNFTRRSDQLDLESTCVVVTKDLALQQNLAKEIDNLKKYTSESTIESLNKLVAQHGWRRAMAVRMWLAFVGNKL